jgi:hypothetical protein
MNFVGTNLPIFVIIRINIMPPDIFPSWNFLTFCDQLYQHSCPVNLNAVSEICYGYRVWKRMQLLFWQILEKRKINNMVTENYFDVRMVTNDSLKFGL